MSSVNLNRQKKINDQMKEVMDDFDRFEYFFASHWKHIVMAAVAVVVVVAVIVTAKYVINKNKLEAAQAFGKATDIAQFEAAFAQYSSAPATAYLQLAKQNNEARTILDAGRNYIKGLSAEDRQSAADFAGMINSALAACK